MKIFCGLLTVDSLSLVCKSRMGNTRRWYCPLLTQINVIQPLNTIEPKHGDRYDQAGTHFLPPKTMDELSFQTARTELIYPALEKAQTMQTWTALLDDEMDDKIEIKEVKDYRSYPDENRDPVDGFITRFDVIAMISDETKKATAVMLTGPLQVTSKTFCQISKMWVTHRRKKVIKRRFFNLSTERLLMLSGRIFWIHSWYEISTSWLNQTDLWTLSPKKW